VDDGRRGALVLAVLARDLVRERQRSREPRIAQEPGRLELVLRIRVGIQEDDRDTLHALAREDLGGDAHAVVRERRANAAVRQDPLLDAESQWPGDEWLGRLEQVLPHVVPVLVDAQ